jgi:hypothetical protein
MTLSQELTHLLGLTRELAQAVARENIEGCQTLLAEREKAISRLGSRNWSADEAERATCQKLAVELKETDATLQARLTAHRDRLGEELGRLSPKISPPEASEGLCLDRMV